jgi:hypothetical protein
VLGGGHRIEGGGGLATAAWSSPDADPNTSGWIFEGFNRSPYPIGVFVYAICAIVDRL